MRSARSDSPTSRHVTISKRYHQIDCSRSRATTSGEALVASAVTVSVTGAVAFDEYGDTTSRVLTVYKVASGKWATVETATFAQ